MKGKGQIFSLDFLLSLGVIILCLAIVLQVFELNAYSFKEESVNSELVLIGLMASERLVLGEDVICDVNNLTLQQVPGYGIINCIDTAKLATLTKQDLGIPYDFNCLITGVNFPSCADIPGQNAVNVFDVNRQILVSNGAVLKADLQACMDGAACNIPSGEISVKVWRA